MEIKNEEKKSARQKLKFGIIAAALVIAGLAGGYALGIFAYLKIIGPYASEMKYKKFLEDYLKSYKEDVIGGNTPEETIDLFIDALKKGDYELASKYFTVEQQEIWRKKFQELSKEQVDSWVGKIEENKNNWRKEQQDQYTFEFWYNTGEGENEITHSIIFKKSVNNKWKIGSF